MELRDSGVKGEKFLSSPPSLETESAAFLLPGRSMRVLDQIVATGCGDHLSVVHVVEHGKLPEGCPIAPEFVSVDQLWDVVFPKQADEKGLGGLGVAMFLKQEVQDRPELIHSPPEPMPDPTDLDAHLV